jgi:hypothetical protein
LFLNRFSFLFRLRRIDGFQVAQRDVGVSSQKGEKQDGASGLKPLCPLARFRFLTFTDLEAEPEVVVEPVVEVEFEVAVEPVVEVEFEVAVEPVVLVVVVVEVAEKLVPSELDLHDDHLDHEGAFQRQLVASVW